MLGLCVVLLSQTSEASANNRKGQTTQYSHHHVKAPNKERRANPLRHLPAFNAIGRFNERRKQKKTDGIYHKISTSKGLEKAEWAEKLSNQVFRDRQFNSLNFEKVHGGKALRLKGFKNIELTNKYKELFKKYENFDFQILFDPNKKDSSPNNANNRLTSNASEFTINLGYEAMRALANGNTENLDHELFHVSVNHRNQISDNDSEANMLAAHVIADYTMDIGSASRNYGQFYRIDEVPAIFAMAKSSHRRANNFIKHNDHILHTMKERIRNLSAEPKINHGKRSNTSFTYETKSGDPLFDIETYNNRISVSFVPRSGELPGAPGDKAIRMVMLVSKVQSKAFSDGKLDPLNHALETLKKLSDYSHQLVFDNIVKDLESRY